MKAIDFVTRTSAGAAQYGSISENDSMMTLRAEPGQELSLNLRQSEVKGYARSGGDLQITLADGRVIILEDYFGADGVPDSRLFISADGYLNEVTLVEGGNGTLYAQYGPTEQWGKWSPSEELIFLDEDERVAAIAGTGDEDVSMLGAAALFGGSGLATAAGVGAAAVAASTLIPGDGSGSGDGRIAPSVDQEGPITLGGDGVGPDTDSVTLTGRAEPGSTVTVTLGDKSVETTADDEGNWQAEFAGDNFPSDGMHTATVTVVEPDGTTSDLAGPEVTIDTTPPETSVTQGTEASGEIFNAEEFGQGIELAGSGEPGATISVTVEGVTRETVVSESGSWSVTYEAGSLPEGEYTSAVTVISRDAMGNSTTVTESLVIDTVANAVSISTSQIEGDGTINQAEEADGTTIVGTATPGAVVVVSVQGVEQTVTAGGDGSWSVTFAPGTLPQGTYEAEITASSTDAAGNVNTTTGTVQVDTRVDNFALTSSSGGADGVINAQEAQSGLEVTGTSEPGSTIVVQLGSQQVTAVAGADGSWSATFAANQITPGTYTTTMTATATDLAGNTSTQTQSVTVDTEAGLLTLNADQIGGDGTINQAEAQAGVQVTGRADPGASVTVTLDGVAHEVVAGANGVWTTTYASHEITEGVHDPVVTATTTDAAGNATSVSDTVHVDTRVDNLTMGGGGFAATSDGRSVINGDVAGSGFELTGTVEPGSTVFVSIGGTRVEAAVDASGNWVASFGPGAIAGGEYDAALIVDVTDAAGNTQSLTDTVRVDTLVNALDKDSPVEGDNVVNAAEASDGVTLTGKVEPGSTVTVDLFGKSYTAVVDASGNWRVDLPAADIPQAEESFDMVIRATDAAGNVSSVTDSIAIDTLVPDQPDVVGYFRDHSGNRNTTIETTDEDISIHRVDGPEGAQELNLYEAKDAFLNESTYHFLDGAGAPKSIPDGSELVITGTDDAGNANSTYLVLDEAGVTTVDLGSNAVDGFNIETVDLRFSDQTELTITADMLAGLSENSDTLLVRGGTDDTLTISGASKTGTKDVDGEAYSVYSFDNGSSIVVDDDIKTVI
ncbi:Ig-like domain repeat protein [Roseovarius nubinhibens]|uniref:Ig-like domain-containing protein n=1 Tax=Roseovarius nubinhibens TaxID=314263 RepID=UPI001C0960FC|nr:Ig-like domain-containing protein [Roseovarius nubinhibens]MBU3001018.1 Ig-like domain repeat protein [Roseovarius nubinhibens]